MLPAYLIPRNRDKGKRVSKPSKLSRPESRREHIWNKIQGGGRGPRGPMKSARRCLDETQRSGGKDPPTQVRVQRRYCWVLARQQNKAGKVMCWKHYPLWLNLFNLLLMPYAPLLQPLCSRRVIALLWDLPTFPSFRVSLLHFRLAFRALQSSSSLSWISSKVTLCFVGREAANKLLTRANELPAPSKLFCQCLAES